MPREERDWRDFTAFTARDRTRRADDGGLPNYADDDDARAYVSSKEELRAIHLKRLLELRGATRK